MNYDYDKMIRLAMEAKKSEFKKEFNAIMQNKIALEDKKIRQELFDKKRE